MRKLKIIVGLLCCFLMLTGFAQITNNTILIGEESGELKQISFDQMVSEIAELNDESKAIVESKMVRSISEKLMDKSLPSSNLKNSVENNIMNTTFWSRSQQITVNNYYKPSLVIYYEGYPGDGFGYIRTLLNVSIDRSYFNGIDTITKQFGGNIYVNLEASNRLYFEINGDFFNQGETIVNGGTQITLGQLDHVSFVASNTTSPYAYVYRNGRCRVYSFGDI